MRRAPKAKLISRWQHKIAGWQQANSDSQGDSQVTTAWQQQYQPTKDGYIAVYSNTRKCIKLYAHGSDTYCANMDNIYQKISGTSMACPIMAAVVAQYLQ